MIDLHCHILPDVDDGARNMETALAMCAMAWKDGIEHIVTTPHANEVYFYDRDYLQGVLNEVAEQTGGKPALTLGCDFHFSYENVQAALDNPAQYTIGTTPYLLVEFSDYSLPPSIDENLAKLINLGLKPIITHPERNPLIQRRPERVLDWVRGGCLVQVTGNVLTGRWGKKAQETAHWFFEQHAVHVLASDGHNLESRKPTLSNARKAAAKLAGPIVADALVILNPRAILNGDPVPYCPKPA
jgi:protein-tyrosine phosphatase